MPPANTSSAQEVIIKAEEVNTLEKGGLSTSVKVSIFIGWILYLPFAFFMFAMTGAGMSGGNRGADQSNLILNILLVNGLPLTVMMVFTYFSIKKNRDLLVYLLWSPVLVLFFVMFFVMLFAWFHQLIFY